MNSLDEKGKIFLVHFKSMQEKANSIPCTLNTYLRNYYLLTRDLLMHEEHLKEFNKKELINKG